MSLLPATSLRMQGSATSYSLWRKAREPGACGRRVESWKLPPVCVPPQPWERQWGWIWTPLPLPGWRWAPWLPLVPHGVLQ